MKEKVIKLKLIELSMGMSSDYLKATLHSATFLRIGSSIFGKRVKGKYFVAAVMAVFFGVLIVITNSSFWQTKKPAF